MSVLKYKDASGNWVEVDGAMCGGQLKIDYIERATENSFDLTKYQNCNKFYMIYTVVTNATSDLVCIFSSTDTADGSRWTLANANTTTYIRSGWTQDLIYLANPIKKPTSGLDGIHTGLTTYENGIFTVLNEEVGVSALVIYAE